MFPYFNERYGNASSVHFFGQDAKEALESSFGSDEPFTTYINPIEPSLEHRSTLTEEVDLIKKLSKPEFKMMAETNPKRFLGVKLKL